MSETRESNPQPHDPEPCALPIELVPEDTITSVLPLSAGGGNGASPGFSVLRRNFSLNE